VATAGKGSAGGHSLNGCEAENPIQDEMVLEIAVDSGLGPEAEAGARLTAAAWSQDTVLTLTEAGGETDILYTDFNQPDNPGRAGEAFNNYVGYGCFISGSKATINPTHFTAGTGDVEVGEKGCIFAHEAGHSMGLAHSNLPEQNDSPGAAHSAATSIMRGDEHTDRCHVAAPPGRPRSADIQDISTYY